MVAKDIACSLLFAVCTVDRLSIAELECEVPKILLPYTLLCAKSLHVPVHLHVDVHCGSVRLQHMTLVCSVYWHMYMYEQERIRTQFLCALGMKTRVVQ